MSGCLETLRFSLLTERRESPLVEWKPFFPRKKGQSKEKNLFARLLTSLANSTVLQDRDSAFCFVGISDDGGIVGVERRKEDLKVLTDILESRIKPTVPLLSFKYITKRELTDLFPENQIPNGVYCIEVGKPVDVPFRYYEDGKGYGGTLIRKGESVVDASPTDLILLNTKIRLGAVGLLRNEDKEMLRRVAHDSQRVADSLKRGNEREASRVAYRLLLAHDGPTLFLSMQFSPILLVPMVLEGVNPFSLIFTANGYRLHLSVRTSPKHLVAWNRITDLEDKIRAWESLGGIAESLLSEGLPPHLRDIYTTYYFHDFVREVGAQAKKILATYSEKTENRIPFHWIGRAYPIAPVRELPPKDWRPIDEPWWVDGLIWFSRKRRRFSERGLTIQLPCLDGARVGQVLIWWAILLDAQVFSSLLLWSEVFRGERISYPWEREASDLFHEGRIGIEEYGRRLSRRGRLDTRPLLVFTVLATVLFSVQAYVMKDWLVMGIPTIFWILIGVLKLMTRSTEDGETSRRSSD